MATFGIVSFIHNQLTLGCRKNATIRKILASCPNDGIGSIRKMEIAFGLGPSKSIERCEAELDAKFCGGSANEVYTSFTDQMTEHMTRIETAYADLGRFTNYVDEKGEQPYKDHNRSLASVLRKFTVPVDFYSKLEAMKTKGITSMDELGQGLRDYAEHVDKQNDNAGGSGINLSSSTSVAAAHHIDSTNATGNGKKRLSCTNQLSFSIEESGKIAIGKPSTCGGNHRPYDQACPGFCAQLGKSGKRKTDDTGDGGGGRYRDGGGGGKAKAGGNGRDSLNQRLGKSDKICFRERDNGPGKCDREHCNFKHVKESKFTNKKGGGAKHDSTINAIKQLIKPLSDEIKKMKSDQQCTKTVLCAGTPHPPEQCPL